MHRHASGSVDFGELIMAFEALNTQPQVIFRFYAYCFFGGAVSVQSQKVQCSTLSNLSGRIYQKESIGCC